MNVLDRIDPVLRQKRASLENPDTSLVEWVNGLDGGSASTAGVGITEASAMRISTVYTCVLVIAETIASLPLQVFQRTKTGKVARPDHPIYPMLHDAPNDINTSFYWRLVAYSHVLLWGNHYSLIRQTSGGVTLSLEPMLPWSVRPERIGRKVVYHHNLESGGVETLPAEEVLHIPGLGFDGISGFSVVRNAANTLGLARAAEDFGSRFFVNDARPGIAIEMPAKLSQNAREKLRASMESAVGGKNRWKVMALEEGAKLHEIGVPPEDAQFLETRKFQRSDIFGLFRVPPHMGGDLERATFSNIEHQDLAFAKHTIRPWLVRSEQEFNRKLFSTEETGKMFAEYNIEGLLRGDFKSRMDSYHIAVGGPFLTVNEIRRRENMEDIDGGDALRAPLNFGTVMADGTIKAQDKPAEKQGAPDA